MFQFFSCHFHYEEPFFVRCHCEHIAYWAFCLSISSHNSLLKGHRGRHEIGTLHVDYNFNFEIVKSANELQMSWIVFDLLELGVKEERRCFGFDSLVSMCRALFIGDTHTNTRIPMNPNVLRVGTLHLAPLEMLRCMGQTQPLHLFWLKCASVTQLIALKAGPGKITYREFIPA